MSYPLRIFQNLLAFTLSAAALTSAFAQTSASVAARAQVSVDRRDFPSWWTPKLPSEVERDVQSKGNRLATQLDLNDEPKTQRVATLTAEHFARVWAWHQQVDDKINAGWKAWDAARDNSGGKDKDELKALLVWTEQLAPIYAEFAPQTHYFLESLTREVGAEKTTLLQDLITRSPGAKRTYEAYLEMIPEMKDDEKALLWSRMVLAREESMAAWSDKEIIKLFKLYKIRNEASIDHFGYDYRLRYQRWLSRK